MQTYTTPQPPQVTTRLVHRYLVAVMIIGVTLMAIPAITGLPGEPFILIMVFGPLLGGAVFTARRSGPGGVRRLFSGVFRWRIGWRNWALAVLSDAPDHGDHCRRHGQSCFTAGRLVDNRDDLLGFDLPGRHIGHQPVGGSRLGRLGSTPSDGPLRAGQRSLADGRCLSLSSISRSASSAGRL